MKLSIEDAYRALSDKEFYQAAKKALEKLAKELGKLRVIHVCGTHENTISRYGIRSLLPKGFELIAGPGCPVCVTPAGEIDAAIELALQGVTVLTFGDMIRVPGSEMSLAEARARGGKVVMVYSFNDAVERARKNPNEEFVFMAIGFETTAATTAPYIALEKLPPNLSILSCHRLIPPAMELLSCLGNLDIDAYIAPGHVSTIIGCEPYRVFVEAYRQSVVVAGFEPFDVVAAVIYAAKAVLEGEPALINEYSRVVRWEGNVAAKKFIERAFDVVDGRWRGIGLIPNSKLELKDRYRKFDAEERYGLTIKRGRDIKPACKCGDVMIGRAKPSDCPMFGKACTPASPYGPCMVSSEGTCRIWYQYGEAARELH